MPGVLEFIAGHPPGKPFPRRIPVQEGDRYLLDLLLRFACRQTGLGARVSHHEPERRRALEERNLFGRSPVHLVLSAPTGFARSVAPAPGVHLISQEPRGSTALEPEPFELRNVPMALRALIRSLGLPWTYGDLRRVDWSWCRSWGDLEPLLVQGRILGWDVGDLALQATGKVPGSVLALVASGEWASLAMLTERQGPAWVVEALCRALHQAASAKELVEAGWDAPRLARGLELSRRQAEQLETTCQVLSWEDLEGLARRIVTLDPLTRRLGRTGVEVLTIGRQFS